MEKLRTARKQWQVQKVGLSPSENIPSYYHVIAWTKFLYLEDLNLL